MFTYKNITNVLFDAAEIDKSVPTNDLIFYEVLLSFN